MLFKLSTAFILTIVPMSSLANAASCGGRGSFAVPDVGGAFNGVTLRPKSVSITQRGSAQICIVNLAPNTEVRVSPEEVDDAVSTVISGCCESQFQCAGGQQKITATTGNVIDLSVQGLGQDCTA
ncbi:MAG: hypothetical protein M1813_004798 [Trichoglossum hirsutum]|nr:MAG: hypothetical protein M1813_004798 [Trichoglossum hirsutum]